jgi:hypothetical protein
VADSGASDFISLFYRGWGRASLALCGFIQVDLSFNHQKTHDKPKCFIKKRNLNRDSAQK